MTSKINKMFLNLSVIMILIFIYGSFFTAINYMNDKVVIENTVIKRDGRRIDVANRFGKFKIVVDDDDKRYFKEKVNDTIFYFRLLETAKDEKTIHNVLSEKQANKIQEKIFTYGIFEIIIAFVFISSVAIIVYLIETKL